MSDLLSAIGNSDRVSPVRHIALVVATLIAYVWWQELRVGNSVLWIIGVAAVLNLQAYLMARRPEWRGLARFLSFAYGVLGWTVLVYFTGGVPVRLIRKRAGREKAARATWLSAFLMYCASSRTTVSQGCSARISASIRRIA